MDGTIIAVNRAARHTMSKPNQLSIRLLAGLGVEGDAHSGATVKHRSRVAREPEKPNLRQVHLIQSELHDELRSAGFDLQPGQMGENITTTGVDLLALLQRARLHLGTAAVITITGLRTPCAQLDGLQQGLMAAAVGKGPNGAIERKAGVMAVVETGGELCPGDPIRVELPEAPHEPLQPV